MLAGVSHATGWIANAALALVLGLSLNPMHKRADAFIDFVFFRKRNEDERALLDFSKESAYVTDAQVLLDQTLDKLRRHTDARDAAILIEAAGTYAAVRFYGGVTAPAVDENDPAVLALKAWHRPLDPHRYAGAMCGALALPMVARGRLLGAIVLSESAAKRTRPTKSRRFRNLHTASARRSKRSRCIATTPLRRFAKRWRRWLRRLPRSATKPRRSRSSKQIDTRSIRRSCCHSRLLRRAAKYVQHARAPLVSFRHTKGLRFDENFLYRRIPIANSHFHGLYRRGNVRAGEARVEA